RDDQIFAPFPDEVQPPYPSPHPCPRKLPRQTPDRPGQPERQKGPLMQFGIFTVGDLTMDPTTGQTQTEHQRLKSMMNYALKAEEVGLDVFATGEHHNPPFVPSSPTTMLGWIAA